MRITEIPTIIAYTANTSEYPYYFTVKGVIYPPIIIATPVAVVILPNPRP